MSLQPLLDKIDERGVAHAIVILDRKVMEQHGTDEITALGRAPRSSSIIQDPLLNELTTVFNAGHSSLKTLADAARRPDVTTSLSRSETFVIEAQLKRPSMVYYPHLGIAYGAVNKSGAESLHKHRAVNQIHHAPPELSLIRPKVEEIQRNGANAKDNWGLARMGAPQLWEQGFTGSGVVIAQLDTGADSRHAALQGAIVKDMFFNDQGKAAGSQHPYVDTESHGTHTAGILAGRLRENGPRIGMAPGASLICGTVVDSGDNVARVLSGMDWALATGARILNLSLGFPGRNDSFEAVVDILRQQDLLPVIAIGNEGAGSSRSPGNCKNALSVGATDDKDQVWVDSSSEQNSRESGPLLCAPGVKISSSIPGGDYNVLSGSSMATPHVAGLAALLFDAKPKATIDQVQEAILASCEMPAGATPDRIGRGIPNGLKALQILDGILS